MNLSLLQSPGYPHPHPHSPVSIVIERTVSDSKITGKYAMHTFRPMKYAPPNAPDMEMPAYIGADEICGNMGSNKLSFLANSPQYFTEMLQSNMIPHKTKSSHSNAS